MLEGMFGKVIAGMLSFSTLFFSSYTGNEPVFKPLQCRTGKNYLIVRAKLESAFDNDFTDVFKCGKPINIWFKADLKSGSTVLYTRNYRHTVNYDPMNETWQVFFSENSQTEVYTTYTKLLSSISELEVSVPVEPNWKTVVLRVESWLQPVEISNSRDRIDLMVLWKYKRPSVKTTLDLTRIS
ncbi:MAG: hypothetical protein FJ041_00850 [Candidatus Cloacimonetes bacterium]|nr:hypothetical protein [Candidatus Cloacimonadota bacterium]